MNGLKIKHALRLLKIAERLITSTGHNCGKSWELADRLAATALRVLEPVAPVANSDDVLDALPGLPVLSQTEQAEVQVAVDALRAEGRLRDQLDRLLDASGLAALCPEG